MNGDLEMNGKPINSPPDLPLQTINVMLLIFQNQTKRNRKELRVFYLPIIRRKSSPNLQFDELFIENIPKSVISRHGKQKLRVFIFLFESVRHVRHEDNQHYSWRHLLCPIQANTETSVFV